MDAGLLYFATGEDYLVRLAVSLYSLRRLYTGPVAVLTACPSAGRALQRMVSDPRLGVQHHLLPGAVSGRRQSYLFKTELWQHSPFERTVYLDCDTLIRGPLDELFTFPSAEHLIATQFCNWQTSGRIISKRIRSWGDTHPHLVGPALAFGPAINTGVFAFTRRTSLLSDWSRVAVEGKHHFIPDELAMQLLLPHHPHSVLDGRFNCSPVYGDPYAATTRIVHFHGGKHLRPESRCWQVAFAEAWRCNWGCLHEWIPDPDRCLEALVSEESICDRTASTDH